MRFAFGILQRPLTVLVLCLIAAFGHLLLDGSLLQIWSLQREKQDLEKRIAQGATEMKTLVSQIKSAQRLEYVERQARDQLELVQDGDLIFVFSDEVKAEN